MPHEKPQPGAGVIAVLVIVRGRVQGVGFRWFVQQAATRERVAGYVRNLPGGEVEVLAQGTSDAVEALVAAVRQGPSFSRVDGIDRREVAPEEGLDRFEVRY